MTNWLKNKFQRDVSWNVLTFAIMSVSGIALNILILTKYGTEILGAFNQVYAVYIFASQLAVFGIYASVLKSISEHSEDRAVCNEIITSALIIGIGAGTLVSLSYYFAIPSLERFLDSALVAKGLFFSIVGLWCFALNKILLAFLNGLRQMKAFALFTAFRYIMMPLSLLILIFFGFPGYLSPLVFSLTESSLLIFLLIFSFRFFSITPINRCLKWFRVHLLFGGKSLVGGTVTEMNSRIDVFMLGIFFNDKIVGIYSLAAIFAEGFAQIPVIFQVNYNPLLTKFVISKRFEELSLTIKTFLKKWTSFALIITSLAVLIYPLLVKLISNDPELVISWAVFVILVTGIMIRSGYAVFWELPSQSGYPGHQTILIMLVIGSNILLNYLLIPTWGIYGAAIATSISFILSIFYLKLIIKKLLNIVI